MLKITRLPHEPAFSKNNGSRSASSKNDDSRQNFEKNDNNGKVNRFGVRRNGVKYTKKSEKLFKSGKSKSEKMSKS